MKDHEVRRQFSDPTAQEVLRIPRKPIEEPTLKKFDWGPDRYESLSTVQAVSRWYVDSLHRKKAKLDKRHERQAREKLARLNVSNPEL